MTTGLYHETQTPTCQAVRVVSERVPGGTWPAAVRAVILCGSSVRVFEDGRPRVIVQWAARVDGSMPHRLPAISQYATLDPAVMTVDGIGSVCLALFGSVPAHLTDLEIVGRSCMITVGTNGWQKNRVLAHTAMAPGTPPVMMPPGLRVTGDICDMDPVVFGGLDVPPTMRNARLLIARGRGMI